MVQHWMTIWKPDLNRQQGQSNGYEFAERLPLNHDWTSMGKLFLEQMYSSEGGELWKECIRWLADMQVMPQDESYRLRQAPDGMTEFAHRIRDGLLLCKLANSIEAEAVPEKDIMFMHTHSQFGCHKNICLFLGACHDKFGMNQGDLFEASELYALSNFIKVLSTLSKLSFNSKALEHSVEPFPKKSQSNWNSSTTSDLPSEEEEIYRSLENNENLDVDMEQACYSNGYRNIEENAVIYDSLVQRRDSQKQRPEDAWSQFAPKDNREHSIKELLDTEQNYVEKALDMILNKFYSPLQSTMKHEDHKTVFMNIKALWNLHHQFYLDLRAAVLATFGLEVPGHRPSSIPRYIGDVFVLHKDKFIAYGPYCMGLADSRKRIDHLEDSDSSIYNKIKECTQAVNNNQFKLQDLLCLPMQRVLKYTLLLTAIKKHTSMDSPDRISIDRAKDAMEDINNYVNEMKRDYESKQLILQIQNSILNLTMPGDMTLVDYGRLHIDEEVKLCEVTRECSNPTRVKQRHVFLFDKVLIVCKANKGSTYSYKSAYVLSELRLDVETPPNGEVKGTFSRKFNVNGTHWLALVRDNIKSDKPDEVRSINMSFKKLSTMQHWYNSIEQAKDNQRPKDVIGTDHNVHMFSTPTDSAYQCSVCEQLLKGLFFQGYKCDTCERVFHKECIRSQKCTGPARRRRTTTGTPEGISRRGSNVSSVVMGDRVVAICSSFEPDLAPYEKDDVIIVKHLNTDNTFEGVIQKNNIAGKIRIDHVSRIRSPSFVENSRPALLNGNGNGNAVNLGRKSTTVLPRPLSKVPMSPLIAAQDYVNTEIAQQIWYKGNMERPAAENRLRGTPSGTFLVRYSPNREKYAISICYEGEVKHMVIESQNGSFFLDEGYLFDTIVQLVNYYRQNNLIESFSSLNTTLKTPYNKHKLFKVIHDFQSEENTKFLELKKGEIVLLMDVVGQDRGWWKGRIENRTGFFPLSYVEPVESDGE